MAGSSNSPWKTEKKKDLEAILTAVQAIDYALSHDSAAAPPRSPVLRSEWPSMSSRCTKQDCEARQQDPDPSAVVRRTTPEAVRAPPDASICASQVLREQDRTSACARARRCRASIVPRTATHKAARKVAGKAALLRVKQSLSTNPCCTPPE